MTSFPGFEQLGTNTEDVVSDPITLPERMIFGDTTVATAFVRQSLEARNLLQLYIKFVNFSG